MDSCTKFVLNFSSAFKSECVSIPFVDLCSRSINKYRDSNYQQEEDEIYYYDGDDFDDYQEEKPGVQDSEYYYYDDQPPAPPNFFQSMDFPRYVTISMFSTTRQSSCMTGYLPNNALIHSGYTQPQL